MNATTTALLGGIAGVTIFIGLPIARVRAISKTFQGFLNAIATGVLVFLLWDILAHAGEPVEEALTKAHEHGGYGEFAWLGAVFAAGIAIGLLSIVYFNSAVAKRLRGSGDGDGHNDGPSMGMTAPPPHVLGLMIAIGLGLHNFSEGLAIGQSAASGAIAFAGILVVGFALHNITEGFGIAAPMAAASAPVSWGFLALTGLIGGGPTFIGTIVGYLVHSTPVYVLFLALAAGAIIYVLNELFVVCRRLSSQRVMAWGILAGLLAAYATDLLLVAAGS